MTFITIWWTIELSKTNWKRNRNATYRFYLTAYQFSLSNNEATEFCAFIIGPQWYTFIRSYVHPIPLLVGAMLLFWLFYAIKLFSLCQYNNDKIRLRHTPKKNNFIVYVRKTIRLFQCFMLHSVLFCLVFVSFGLIPFDQPRFCFWWVTKTVLWQNFEMAIQCVYAVREKNRMNERVNNRNY